ncbi:MAG: D-aminoacylase [Proteobacteria bacterium]|nr:D-aminoacylase [Pseudomonadota bacterium]
MITNSQSSHFICTAALILSCHLLLGCAGDSPEAAQTFDTIIRGGTLYDGSGGSAYASDLGISGGKITAIGDLSDAVGQVEVDATGKAVSPGFINMIAWGVTSLIRDGRGISDISQGITLEVFGEGNSMGPLSPTMKAEFPKYWDQVTPSWTTLGEYLEFLEEKGVSSNVASFIGATTARIHVLGRDDVEASPAQLLEMQSLVRSAMQEGAVGVASSLIYTPASFASTEELIALASAASEFGGIYASHMRNEGKGIFEALDELITIAREADIPAEIYHLKISYPPFWDRFDDVLEVIEEARRSGLNITADMYPYPAGSTGLDAIMPPWVKEGGIDQWIARMQDPDTRARLVKAMQENPDDWDNRLASGGAESVLLVEFRNPDLKHLAGMTLAEVAQQRGMSPEETAMDLVIEDRTRVGAMYFNQSEDVVRKAIQQPWVSFCTDAVSIAAEGDQLLNHRHPRTYGTFPRVLGHYVRDLQLLSLEQAVHRASGLPATNLSLRNRGFLREGYFADVLVFDPATIQDHATFEQPHQYSTGMEKVFVNGELVFEDGEHTGALPGQFVRGPGWTGWRD